MYRKKRDTLTLYVFGCLVISALIGISAFVVYSFCVREKSKALVQIPHAHDFTVVTQDGVRIAGFMIYKKEAKRVVLLCHGYRQSKEDMRFYLALFPHDTIVCFDFRAHGASDGSLITFGYHEKYDVRAVVNFIRSHHMTADLPLVGLGVSMGGAALILGSTRKYRFDALIIDSTFSQLTTQIEEIFTAKTGLWRIPFLPITFALFSAVAWCRLSDINPARKIEKINTPLLIIYSPDDQFTRSWHGDLLYERAQIAKRRWRPKDATHGTIIKKYPQLYKEKVDMFLSEQVI